MESAIFRRNQFYSCHSQFSNFCLFDLKFCCADTWHPLRKSARCEFHSTLSLNFCALSHLEELVGVRYFWQPGIFGESRGKFDWFIFIWANGASEEGLTQVEHCSTHLFHHNDSQFSSLATKFQFQFKTSTLMQFRLVIGKKSARY